MIDEIVGYDPYSWNNGVAPEPRLAWDGGAWGWPTTGIDSGDLMIVWPAGDNSVSDQTKELLDNNICLRCGQKNCPYIKNGKDYKELRSALSKGNMPLAKKVYMTRFAQFGGKNKGTFKEALKKQKEAKAKAEKAFLLNISTIVSSSAEGISKRLGKNYQLAADEIANNIKNFQGKRIRNFNDAMASLNKIMSTPGMKINKGDRDAIIHAWRYTNVNDMANKLSNFGRFFKVADLVIKAEKIREKSIEGYESGNWKPLMLEVEAIVLSGVASSVALAIVTGILSLFSMSVLPVIAAILVISIASSFIDASLAETLNNKIIDLLN
ncbi:colicin-like pore-forming protein [Serratia fonticola]|uniref:colicin-like pore-forming protein n=1 Tax=Serratia fonticola TaxID=47917 RepID=UPI002177A435|nr:colicin-like pore-forming protein [Serratia fonticola]CAI1202654.1 Colicin-A [Serratia fonticola]